MPRKVVACGSVLLPSTGRVGRSSPAQRREEEAWGGGEGQRGGERPCPEEARRMRRVQGSFYSRLGSGTVPG